MSIPSYDWFMEKIEDDDGKKNKKAQLDPVNELPKKDEEIKLSCPTGVSCQKNKKMC